MMVEVVLTEVIERSSDKDCRGGLGGWGEVIVVMARWSLVMLAIGMRSVATTEIVWWGWWQ